LTHDRDKGELPLQSNDSSAQGKTQLFIPPPRANRGPGSVLGGTYRLVEPLGHGGMGTVFLAEHMRVGREVAVKLLRPEHAADPDVIERFCREARAAGSIAHDSVVEIIDVNNEPDGTWFIVMERLIGSDLAGVIRRDGPLPIEKSMEIAKQAANALSLAHARGIVHRDIKPANIFVLDGPSTRIKLLDFGISKLVDGAASITGTGLIIGTPLYMAPEQACGDPSLDHRSDIYSLGAVLYEMLAGRPPFDAAAPMVLIARIMTEDPPPVSRWREDLPAWLDTLVARCLSRSPEGRFQSAEDLANALGRATSTSQKEPTKTEIEPTPEREEIRVVSVACVSFAARSDVRAALSPDESSDHVSNASVAAQAVVAKHGGTVLRHYGDGMMALFGAPVAHGDDAVRALRAMLEIRDTLNRDFASIVARAGVTTGRVAAGKLRGARESGFRVVGNAVGLARRIEGLSSDGSVLACVETCFHVRGRFQVRKFELPALPGACTSEAVFEVAEENPHGLVMAPREVLGQRVPMAGRSVELGQILEAYERATDDRSLQVVTVLGTPGLGKSRLANEVFGRLESNALILAANAVEPSAGTPLAFCADLVRTKAGIFADQAPDEAQKRVDQFVRYVLGEAPDAQKHATVLAQLLGLRLGAAGEAALMDRLEETLAVAFSAFSKHHPIVLVLDDMQWADASSIELLRRVLARSVSLPVLAVLLAREDRDMRLERIVPEGAPSARLVLKPLTIRDSVALITSILGPALPEEVVRKLSERSGGTPLFVEEILHGLAERGTLRQTATGWEIALEANSSEIPLTVEAMVRARLDLLSPEQQRLLEKAATVGEVFWNDAVAALGETDVDARLAALAQREYLRASPSSRFAGSRELAFRHSVVREVSYNAVPVRERRKWHAVVGSWLEEHAGGAAAELAHAGRHFEAAEEMSRAADTYFLAASASLGMGFERPGQNLQYNLELARGAGKRFDPVMIADSVVLFDRATHAAATADDARREVEIAGVAGEVLMTYGDLNIAQRFYLRASVLAERLGEVDLFVRCLSQVGKTYGNNKEIDKAFEVLRIAEAHLTDDISAETACNLERCIAQVHYVSGNIDTSIERSKRALAIASEGGLKLQVCSNAHNIGDDYLQLGDFAKAKHYLELSQGVAKEVDCKLVITINEMFLAALEELIGTPGPGHEQLHLILNEAREHENVWELVQVLYFLGLIHSSRGELVEAERQVRECLEIGERSHNRIYEARANELLEKILSDKTRPP